MGEANRRGTREERIKQSLDNLAPERAIVVVAVQEGISNLAVAYVIPDIPDHGNDKDPVETVNTMGGHLGNDWAAVIKEIGQESLCKCQMIYIVAAMANGMVAERKPGENALMLMVTNETGIPGRHGCAVKWATREEATSPLTRVEAKRTLKIAAQVDSVIPE